MISESIMCLAIALFHEGRGESVKGQQAIAEVIDNRTKHKDFPNSYCGVIKQKGQFSFYKGSYMLHPPNYEKYAWDRSLHIAKNFSKNKTNHTKGSLYFNASRLGVRFGNTLKLKHGGHVFF